MLRWCPGALGSAPVRVPERCCLRGTREQRGQPLSGAAADPRSSRQARPSPGKGAARDPGPGARWELGRPLHRRHSAAPLPRSPPRRGRSRVCCGRSRAGPCLVAPGGAGRGRGAERREGGRGCGAAVARHGPARGDAARHGRWCLLPGRGVRSDGRQEAGKESGWEGPHGAARSPARPRERDKRLARDKVIPE